MKPKEKYILLKAIQYGKEKLNCNAPFTLFLSDKRDTFKTTGYYDPEKHLIAAYTKDRAICDICRSTLHELVHHCDNVNGRINGDEPDVGVIVKFLSRPPMTRLLRPVVRNWKL